MPFFRTQKVQNIIATCSVELIWGGEMMFVNVHLIVWYIRSILLSTSHLCCGPGIFAVCVARDGVMSSKWGVCVKLDWVRIRHHNFKWSVARQLFCRHRVHVQVDPAHSPRHGSPVSRTWMRNWGTEKNISIQNVLIPDDKAAKGNQWSISLWNQFWSFELLIIHEVTRPRLGWLGARYQLMLCRIVAGRRSEVQCQCQGSNCPISRLLLLLARPLPSPISSITRSRHVSQVWRCCAFLREGN